MKRGLGSSLMALWIVGCCVSTHAEDRVPTPARPPNVVFIMVDTLRSDHLGCYGYRRATSPNIDRLASEGVLFENCYSAASWTPPAVMSMFTGLDPLVHGCVSSDAKLAAGIPTLAEQFRKKGYYCAAIISNDCLKGKRGYERGFHHYDDYTVFLQTDLALFGGVSPKDDLAVNDIVTGDIVTRQAKTILDKAKRTGKPFFLFVLYFDPHDSYVPPAPYDKRFDADYTGKMNGRAIQAMRYEPPAERDLEHLVARYDGEIAYTDAQIAGFLKKLDEVSEPKNTLTLFVADHGEAFGEHGMLQHGNSAYREEVCVPFIWRWPGVLPRGHRVKAPVSNLDIAKTLNALMHFRGFDLLQGRSLWPGLTGGELPRDRLVLSHRALDRSKELDCTRRHVALTCGVHRLHARFDEALSGKEAKFELFDVSKDPGEVTPIAVSRPTALHDRLKASAHGMWSQSLDIRHYYHKDGKTPRTTLTDAERRRLESMGYLTPRKK